MATDPQTLIRRRKPAVLKAVENLDAFPKVPETCVETTSYGGTASIVALVIISWLVILEISYFFNTGYKFYFSPDTDLDEKIKINVDITIAMPCSIIGADIVDSTNQNVLKFGELEEEFVYFELSSKQRNYFSSKAKLNSYLREQYHSLQNLLWHKDFIDMYAEMPKLSSKEKFDMGPAMACRLHGSLVLNKVAGNFHITAGKTLPLPRGHAHIAAFMSERDYNFSHRIYKFSFGDGTPAVVHPLEGDEKVANINHMSYQYFIQVVPTMVTTKFGTYKTFQYSVRELAREIDHEKGSHGISGIFFKYDMSGLKVEVKEETYPWWRFLIRLCAVIGGVYATVGMIYSLASNVGRTLRNLGEDSNSSVTNSSSLNSVGSAVMNSKPTQEKNQHNILTGNATIWSSQNSHLSSSTPTFETPVVQFVSQENTVKSQQPLCDIASDSHIATNLDSDNDRVNMLPDLLSSHTST